MTLEPKKDLASDDRRSGTREDAEATTKATERKTQGHYQNDESDGEMERTGSLSLSSVSELAATREENRTMDVMTTCPSFR